MFTISRHWYTSRRSVARRRRNSPIRRVRPIITASKTVTGKLQSTMLACGTYAMHVWLSGRVPKTVIVPPWASTIPAIARNSVLLPAPFGPTTATESPLRSTKDTFSRARSPPG